MQPLPVRKRPRPVRIVRNQYRKHKNGTFQNCAWIVVSCWAVASTNSTKPVRNQYGNLRRVVQRNKSCHIVVETSSGGRVCIILYWVTYRVVVWGLNSLPITRHRRPLLVTQHVHRCGASTFGRVPKKRPCQLRDAATCMDNSLGSREHPPGQYG